MTLIYNSGFIAEHETDGLEEPVNITEVFDDIEASSVDDDHSIASSNMTWYS